jgi:hypothetical protein
MGAIAVRSRSLLAAVRGASSLGLRALTAAVYAVAAPCALLLGWCFRASQLRSFRRRGGGWCAPDLPHPDSEDLRWPL